MAHLSGHPMHLNFLFCLPGHDLSAIANSIKTEMGENFPRWMLCGIIYLLSFFYEDRKQRVIIWNCSSHFELSPNRHAPNSPDTHSTHTFPYEPNWISWWIRNEDATSNKSPLSGSVVGGFSIPFHGLLRYILRLALFTGTRCSLY